MTKRYSQKYVDELHQDIEFLRKEHAKQKQLTAEWRELALDIMTTHMSKEDIVEFTAGALDNYLRSKVK